VKIKVQDFSLTLKEAVNFRNDVRKKGKTFVLTNGCFDLLHSGHVHSLREASMLGDYLWVAINSDKSIRGLKGKHRPIISELDRAYIVSNLACVAGVTIFNTERLDKEILLLQPDVYVKAGDYNKTNIAKIERDALDKVDAKLKFVSFLPEKSTSAIIDEITLKGN
jgi:rfaE bifunctional protein nucleotidyltransferase chain/domain